MENVETVEVGREDKALEDKALEDKALGTLVIFTSTKKKQILKYLAINLSKLHDFCVISRYGCNA